MAVSKEEAFAAFKKLAKGNEAVAKTMFDYVILPFGSVSTITLYKAVMEVHDEVWAMEFTDCLEEIKKTKKIK